jgi:glycosyltransferase involved in cell wall biosynthesis
LKILLVFYEPMPAGQTTHVLSLARALDNCKYRVRSPQAVVTLARLIRRQDIDIVHVHSQEAGLLGRLVARAAGARRVIYTPQTIDIRRVRFHWLYVLIERILARVTDVIISVNEPDRERLIRWGIPPHKIVTIPNGIDLSPSAPSTTLMTGSLGVNSIEGACPACPEHSRGKPVEGPALSAAEGACPACPERSRGKPAEGPVDVGSLRRALGLDEDRPLVMQVARLSAQKDPLAFVEGAAHVVRERPDVQFALVGEGPLTEATAKRVRALGLDEHVHLLGWRDEAFNLMAAADVVSLTSRWEGAPHTLLEAMAWSRPVVATAVNGCPEIVVDGGTGFLVPPGDTKAWARRIIDLLSDPVMAAAMGREGRIRVEERFSLREMATRIEGPYQQVAQAHKRPQIQHPRTTAGSVLSSIFRSFQRE